MHPHFFQTINANTLRKSQAVRKQLSWSCTVSRDWKLQLWNAALRCPSMMLYSYILRFLHQVVTGEAFEAVWHHFTRQGCFWVASTSCLLTAELPGTRLCLRRVLNIKSCCSFSQRFIRRGLINRHPNQFSYQSIRWQKPPGRYLHTERAPVRRGGSGRLVFPSSSMGM